MDKPCIICEQSVVTPLLYRILKPDNGRIYTLRLPVCEKCKILCCTDKNKTKQLGDFIKKWTMAEKVSDDYLI